MYWPVPSGAEGASVELRDVRARISAHPSGKVLGWSCLHPPYRWKFGAGAEDHTCQRIGVALRVIRFPGQVLKIEAEQLGQMHPVVDGLVGEDEAEPDVEGILIRD